jgi:hypothetical protein
MTSPTAVPAAALTPEEYVAQLGPTAAQLAAPVYALAQQRRDVERIARAGVETSIPEDLAIARQACELARRLLGILHDKAIARRQQQAIREGK